MAQPSRMVYQTEDTRNLILERAEAVFVERGFFDARMKDIAESVGMSRHTLYRYFQNKIDLGMAIAGQILAAQGTAVSERLDALLVQTNRSGLERLKEFLLEDAVRLIGSADGRFLAEFDAYFTTHRAPPDFRERFIEQGLIPPPSLQALIAQGQADGSLRNDLTLAQVIKAVTGLRAVQKEVVLRGDLLLGIEIEEVGNLPSELAEIMVAGMSSQIT